MASWRAKLAFAPDLMGIFALILPFSSGMSPILVFLFVFQALGPRGPRLDLALSILLLAVPLFLVVPILAWRIRRALSVPLTTLELRLTYFLSVVAMLGVLTFWVTNCLFEWSECNYTHVDLFALAVYTTLALGNVLLLLYNDRRQVASQRMAEAFLIGGYMPHAVYLLIATFPEGFWSGWDTGAYVVLLVCVAYLIQIVMTERQVLR